jgi:small multidrug resistance family-3 protein
LWLHDGRSSWYGFFGGFVLAIYGIVAPLQTANFGRVYAMYGSIFIVMSFLWGWKVEQVIPDRYNLVGALVVMIGVAIMVYAPRNS